MNKHDRIEKVIQIGDWLRKQNYTVTSAESCTGGGIAHAFTSVSGSSDWFEQSWVTYSNKAKHTLIGVTEKTLSDFGAVSKETVIEMAEGAAQKANAQLAVSVSGIAGPSGGTPQKPVGLVWFGLYNSGEISTYSQVFSGERDAVREQAIDFAITILAQSTVEK